MKKNIYVGLIFVLFLFTITGCFNKSEVNEKLRIVTTTTMLYDLATAISSDKAEVIGLMGSGIDPHLYKASAGDVQIMQSADVIVYNGLHLEGKLSDVFENLRKVNKAVICVTDGIDKNKLLKVNDNNFDPHVWFDVSLWREVAINFTEKLNEKDSENKEFYNEKLISYLNELDLLDSYIKEKISEIPENSRILVTAHDAFGYLGKAYGFEVRGLQGISTETEAGTADIRDLATYIANKKVRSIFVETSVPIRTIKALEAAVKAKGFEVTIGGELYSDSLGDDKSGNNTYIKTFKSNIDTISESLK